MKIYYSITALGLFFTVFSVHAGDIMKAFPPPDKGKVRYVLQLQKLDDESTYKVELIVGKTVLVDKKNQYFFGGKIQEETIELFRIEFMTEYSPFGLYI